MRSEDDLRRGYLILFNKVVTTLRYEYKFDINNEINNLICHIYDDEDDEHLIPKKN